MSFGQYSRGPSRSGLPNNSKSRRKKNKRDIFFPSSNTTQHKILYCAFCMLFYTNIEPIKLNTQHVRCFSTRKEREKPETNEQTNKILKL